MRSLDMAAQTGAFISPFLVEHVVYYRIIVRRTQVIKLMAAEAAKVNRTYSTLALKERCIVP